MSYRTIRACRGLVILLVLALALGIAPVAQTSAQIDTGDSYFSEQFGYQVSWQSPWFYVDAEANVDYDQVVLSDGVANAYIIFSNAGGTSLSEIVEFLVAGPDDQPFISVQTALDVNGIPIEGSDVDRAWGAYLGHLEGAPDDDVSEFRYGESRQLEGDVAVGLVIEEPSSEFTGSVDAWSSLLDGVTKATTGSSSEITDPSGARLVFDPSISTDDRELITESVRLAEDFFVARFDAPLGADITVTALPIAGPNDDELIAATLGNSIVIYAQSIGWVESPPSERIRTVIHEYTHAYQFSKTAESPFESAGWFEEGVAEYLSLLALSDLGLVDRSELEGYFGVVVTHSPELPPLEQLESYDTMQAQGGEVYPLSYFGVSYLLQDLPLSSIDAYYTNLEQGMSFEAAFEQAYGVTPAAFYQDFAVYRQNLPLADEYPPSLEITEGIHQAAEVVESESPLVVIPGEQTLVVAQTLPGTFCTLDLADPNATVQINDRETFANGVGQVFWLVTMPVELASGDVTFGVSCGAEVISARAFAAQPAVAP